MSNSVSRRELLKLGFTGAIASQIPVRAAEPTAKPINLLTPAKDFRDVARNNPHPSKLKPEDLAKAKLTPETWRLEIVADGGAEVAKPMTLADNSALTLPKLQEMARTHGVKFLKAMQCLNIDRPLGQGLWEGVPLAVVLQKLGKLDNVRRLYYWGFHNYDPKQIFRSSLSYTQAMETPPWELPPFLAFRLNGEPLTLDRGGPVRMLVPWAHGFKSIKWLQRIVLTNDYKANDTYAEQNNDPESHLKTAAYLTDVPAKATLGKPVVVRGLAIVGLSGFKRVEYWLRPSTSVKELADDDPAWQTAKWIEAPIDPAPTDWSTALPAGIAAKDVWGFTAAGQPKEWPLRYSNVGWSVELKGLSAGKYEIRARTVDLNNFAQPQPRPNPKAGRNGIQVRRFEIT